MMDKSEIGLIGLVALARHLRITPKEFVTGMLVDINKNERYLDEVILELMKALEKKAQESLNLKQKDDNSIANQIRSFFKPRRDDHKPEGEPENSFKW